MKNRCPHLGVGMHMGKKEKRVCVFGREKEGSFRMKQEAEKPRLRDAPLDSGLAGQDLKR